MANALVSRILHRINKLYTIHVHVTSPLAASLSASVSRLKKLPHFTLEVLFLSVKTDKPSGLVSSLI